MRTNPELLQLKQQLAQAARPNLLEKAIGFFAPGMAAQRMKARVSIAWGAGYVGARWDRAATKTWHAPNLAADETTLWDLLTLRARSRDLVRNAPIAAGAINTVCQNVIGSGLKLQSNPDFEALNKDADWSATFKKNVEREWRLFADTPNCDITRMQDFYGLQDLAFRSALEGGDCFAMLPMIQRQGAVYKTCVQVIEAERIANPWGKTDGINMRAGIEIDDYGTPVAYNIRKFHPFSTAGTMDRASTRVLAFGAKTGRRNVLHLMDRKRPGQSRGVPYLASVIELLKQLERYSDAEIMAAVINAMFTVFITTPTGDGLLQNPDELQPSGQVPSVTLDPNDVALGNGSIVDLMPGEKPEFANPSRPNAQFDPFFQAIVRQIGIALSIPFEVLIKHFTASYSAARAALLDAWVFFYNRRDWLTAMFCQPVYETWFEEAVAAGRIDAPGFFDDPAIRLAYLRATWIGDAPTSLDPLKDAQAAQAMLDAKLTTRSDQAMQLTGKVFEEQVAVMEREEELLTKAGLTPVIPPGKPNAPNPDQAAGGDLEQPEAPKPAPKKPAPVQQ